MRYTSSHKTEPPKWARQFLEWYCHPDLLEEIQGDLNEVFHEHISLKKPIKADVTFIIQVILFFRPSTIRNFHPIFSTMLLLNYFKIAVRTSLKQGGHTLINLMGLSVALACATCIALYVSHQFSFNKAFPKAAHIYVADLAYNGRSNDFTIPARIGPDFYVNPHSEVEAVTRIYEATGDFSLNRQRFTEEGLYVDSSFFNVLEFEVMTGDGQSIFRDTNSVVLSQSLVDKYFPDQEPLNQVIEIGFEPYTVTGVMEDLPDNVSFQADYLLPFSIVESWGIADWHNCFSYSIFKLRNSEKAQGVANEMRQRVMRNVEDSSEVGIFSLLPISEYHLYDTTGSKKRALWSLSLIAIAILLIASINFANLVMVSSISRSSEIGLRKLLGARRKQLIFQFMIETLTLSLIAVLMGFLWVRVSYPFFQEWTQIRIPLSHFTIWEWMGISLSTWLGIGLLTGLYPAWYQMQMKIADSLKGKLQFKPKGVQLRNVLVTVQFTLAITIILATTIMWKQIQFMKQKELGVDTDNIYTVRVTPYHFEDQDKGVNRIKRMKEEIRQIPGVEYISSSHSIPSEYIMWGMNILPQDNPEEVWIRYTRVDAEYFPTFGMRFIEGRNFADSVKSDIFEKVIINETAKKAFGWKEAVGKTIQSGDDRYIVMGVVKDYFYQSLENEIEPLVHFFPGKDEAFYYRFVSVKIPPHQLEKAIPLVREEIQQMDSEYTFNSFFVDDHFDELYQQLETRGKLAAMFSFVAILIACLGLFALAAFNTQQRTKEMGIRKILGATLVNLLVLLLKHISLLIIISGIIAAPLAYFFMKRWLEDFAYQTPMNMGLFLLAGGMILMIAWLTVSYHVLKVAKTNPIHSLRTE